MKLFFLPAFMLLLAACASAMTINGKVAVAGHEPFTYVRLIDRDQREYKLIGPEAGVLLRQYQQAEVILRGRVVKGAQGPGYPAEFAVEKIIEKR